MSNPFDEINFNNGDEPKPASQDASSIELPTTDIATDAMLADLPLPDDLLPLTTPMVDVPAAAQNFNILTDAEMEAFINRLDLSDEHNILDSGVKLRTELEKISKKQSPLNQAISARLNLPSGSHLGQRIIPVYPSSTYTEERRDLESIVRLSNSRISDIESISTLDPQAIVLLEIMKKSHETIIAACKLFINKADAVISAAPTSIPATASAPAVATPYTTPNPVVAQTIIVPAEIIDRKIDAIWFTIPTINLDPYLISDANTYDQKMTHIQNRYIQRIESLLSEIENTPNLANTETTKLINIKRLLSDVQNIMASAEGVKARFDTDNFLTSNIEMQIDNLRDRLNRAKNVGEVNTVRSEALVLVDKYQNRIKDANRTKKIIPGRAATNAARATADREITVDSVKYRIVLPIVFGGLAQTISTMSDPDIYENKISQIESATKDTEAETKLIANLEAYKTETAAALTVADASISAAAALLVPTPKADNVLSQTVIPKAVWNNFKFKYDKVTSDLSTELRSKLDKIEVAHDTMDASQKIKDKCAEIHENIIRQIKNWEGEYDMMIIPGGSITVGAKATTIQNKYALVDGVKLRLDNGLFADRNKSTNVVTPNLLGEQRPLPPMPISAQPAAKRAMGWGVAAITVAVAAFLASRALSPQAPVAPPIKPAAAVIPDATPTATTAPSLTPAATPTAPTNIAVAKPAATPATVPQVKTYTDEQIIDEAIKYQPSGIKNYAADYFYMDPRLSTQEKVIDIKDDTLTSAWNLLRLPLIRLAEHRGPNIAGLHLVANALNISKSEVKNMPVQVLSSQSDILRWYRDSKGPFAVVIIGTVDGKGTETFPVFRADIAQNVANIVAAAREANKSGPIPLKLFKGKLSQKYESDLKMCNIKSGAVTDNCTNLIKIINNK